MPTGYTAKLEEMGYDVSRWLKENVVRAMGVCVTLRDNDDMTADEIAAALKKEKANSFHAKKLAKAQKALKLLDRSSETARKKRYNKEFNEAHARYAKDLAKFEKKKEKHAESIETTKKLLSKAEANGESELTVNTLKYALEQLTRAYDFDYGSGCYKPDILNRNYEQWLAALYKESNFNIAYHTKEMKSEKSRTGDRYTEYKKFVEFVDNN